MPQNKNHQFFVKLVAVVVVVFAVVVVVVVVVRRRRIFSMCDELSIQTLLHTDPFSQNKLKMRGER